ncbi:MAG: hypothetical protein FJ291_21125 [Planctomycetes bacterium]|nr:hypothetical protein [Planctomycetota bacterium]
MKARFVGSGVAGLLCLLCAAALAGALQEGVRLEADGKAIDVEVGHLVPCALDWNGDGKKDLVVGQFAGGKIRLYLNQGTDAAPAFKDSSFLQAGSKEISLPCG